MMRTSNPALSDKVLQNAPRLASAEVMTIDGTVNKSILAIGITMFAGYLSYTTPAFWPFALPAVILGFVIALVLAFKMTWAPFLTPVYALVEGVALGAISYSFNQAYDGIVSQAVGLTFAVLLCMLMLYKSGLIPVTEKFRLAVFSATAAIMLFYVGAMLYSWISGSPSLLQSSSPLSIGISVIVVGVAALNLMLDFDFIDRMTKQGTAPKYLEWYGAFALLVTLVWLYVEMLRLLSKLQSRN